MKLRHRVLTSFHEANPELTGKQEVLPCNIFRATTAHK